jgi:UPF0716 family protein affecting phage T7 exclusion
MWPISVAFFLLGMACVAIKSIWTLSRVGVSAATGEPPKLETTTASKVAIPNHERLP